MLPSIPFTKLKGVRGRTAKPQTTKLGARERSRTARSQPSQDCCFASLHTRANLEAKMRIERINTCFACKPLTDWVLGRGGGDGCRTRPLRFLRSLSLPAWTTPPNEKPLAGWQEAVGNRILNLDLSHSLSTAQTERIR